jgi:hypothetical protein
VHIDLLRARRREGAAAERKQTNLGRVRTPVEREHRAELAAAEVVALLAKDTPLGSLRAPHAVNADVERQGIRGPREPLDPRYGVDTREAVSDTDTTGWRGERWPQSDQPV